MNSYRYRVTVEMLTDAKGEPLDRQRVLSFMTANHDNLLEIARGLKTRDLGLDEHESAALAIGLKLFGEVVLTHRKEPLFATLQPALGSFLHDLKSRPEREIESATTR